MTTENMVVNEAVVNEIDRVYGGLLRGICRKYFQDTGYSEDAYQESLIKIWQNYSDNNSNLKSWVCSITAHTCIDIIRRNKKHGHECIEDALNHTRDGKMNPIQRNEVYSLLLECVATLTPRQETITRLRLIDGYSLKEIAVELNIEIGTVKTLLHRSVVILRQAYAAQNYR